MGSVVISGATSGAVTLAVPDEAGTRTLTLPATTGTILTNDISQAGDTSAGNAAAVGYTSAEGLILTGQGSTSDVTIKNDADATVLSIPTGTTKVGIGLTNPTGQFAVSDGTRIAEINPHSSGTFIGNRSDHDVLFQVNAAEKMRITTAGNVGIGTSSPDAMLQVHSAALGTTAGNTQDILQLHSPDTSNNTVYKFFNYRHSNGSSHDFSELRWQRKVDVTNHGYIGLRDGSITFGYGDNTEHMRIDSSGNVGIGTSSPTAPLDVIAGTDQRFLVRELGTGAVVLDAVNAANSAYQTLITNGSEHILRTGGTERMRIDSSGNVLVGTTTANAKLHIYLAGVQDDNNGIIQAQSGNNSASFIARTPIGTSQLFQWSTNGTRLGSRSISGANVGNLYFTTGNDSVRAVLGEDGNFKVGNIGSEAVTIYGNSGGDIVQFHQSRNGSTPYWYFNTSGSYGVFSDKRLKENIVELSQDAAVNLISNIKPVQFTWKEEFGNPDHQVTGFLAQDVLSNATTEGQKNILTNWETYDENDPDCPHMGLSDHRLLPSIVGTIQHLISKVETLEARIAALESN